MILPDYFHYILDYILKSEVLINIAFCRIIKPCHNFTSMDKNNYNQCFQYLLTWNYERLIYRAKSMNQSKQSEYAEDILKRLNEGEDIESFKTMCRDFHKSVV